jgi:hypothetical protein
MISHQTREDIISSIMGFEEFCVDKLKVSNASIIPSRLNSDVIENMFCQQRTLHNGANTNPADLGYCHSVNSVISGQTSISNLMLEERLHNYLKQLSQLRYKHL